MPTASAPAGRYALSFTSGALLLQEADLLAPFYLQEQDWERVKRRATEQNLLKARTVASTLRLARETVQRLSVLNDQEIRLLTELTSTDRGYLLWVAACRRYRLIGEFAEEVLRERFLLLTPTLTHEEFDSFLHGKALWHPELSELSESTSKKIRATLFRMMREASLLDKSEDIMPVLISGALADALTPGDYRYLPTHDAPGGTRS